MNFQMFKLVLEKAEEPEIKLPTSARSSKKQESSRKTSISTLLTMPKPFAGLEDAQARINIARRNINNLRYVDDHPHDRKQRGTKEPLDGRGE